MPDRDPEALDVELEPAGSTEVATDADLPVVARLIVEVRSDGTRTIVRGGLENLPADQRVRIDARGTTPMQLALALVKSLMQVPQLSPRKTIRGLLGRKKGG